MNAKEKNRLKARIARLEWLLHKHSPDISPELYYLFMKRDAYLGIRIPAPVLSLLETYATRHELSTTTAAIQFLVKGLLAEHKHNLKVCETFANDLPGDKLNQ